MAKEWQTIRIEVSAAKELQTETYKLGIALGGRVSQSAALIAALEVASKHRKEYEAAAEERRGGRK